MTVSLALFYYATVSVVSIGVDKICEEFEKIDPLIFNKKTKQFIESHPLLDLLNRPNADETKTDFMGSLSRALVFEV